MLNALAELLAEPDFERVDLRRVPKRLSVVLDMLLDLLECQAQLAEQESRVVRAARVEILNRKGADGIVMRVKDENQIARPLATGERRFGFADDQLAG